MIALLVCCGCSRFIPSDLIGNYRIRAATVDDARNLSKNSTIFALSINSKSAGLVRTFCILPDIVDGNYSVLLIPPRLMRRELGLKTPRKPFLSVFSNGKHLGSTGPIENEQSLMVAVEQYFEPDLEVHNDQDSLFGCLGNTPLSIVATKKHKLKAWNLARQVASQIGPVKVCIASESLFVFMDAADKDFLFHRAGDDVLEPFDGKAASLISQQKPYFRHFDHEYLMKAEKPCIVLTVTNYSHAKDDFMSEIGRAYPQFDVGFVRSTETNLLNYIGNFVGATNSTAQNISVINLRHQYRFPTSAFMDDEEREKEFLIEKWLRPFAEFVYKIVQEEVPIEYISEPVPEDEGYPIKLVGVTYEDFFAKHSEPKVIFYHRPSNRKSARFFKDFVKASEIVKNVTFAFIDVEKNGYDSELNTDHPSPNIAFVPKDGGHDDAIHLFGPRTLTSLLKPLEALTQARIDYEMVERDAHRYILQLEYLKTKYGGKVASGLKRLLDVVSKVSTEPHKTKEL